MIDVTRNDWPTTSGKLFDNNDLVVDPPASYIATISTA
jgi:hypothetical protein